MKISLKLFLSLLGLTIAILTMTLSLASWSFKQGFLEFLVGIEKQRLQRIEKAILEVYFDNGQRWQQIPKEELEVVLMHMPRGRRPPPRRPQSGIDHRENRPPPAHRSRRFDEPPSSATRPPPPRTGLFSSEGLFLAGTNLSDEQNALFVLPIMVNQQKIAELRSWPAMRSDSGLASQFEQQQAIASFVIGAFSILVAGLLSWIIANRLLKPIDKLSNGISRLTKGDYQALLEVDGKDELSYLMHKVNYLGKVLEQNRSSNRRFFADVSHELRTPLTVLKGELDLLKEGIRPLNSECINSLSQEIDLLSHLVEDLYQLSLSDLGRLAYNFEFADLTSVAATVVENLKQQATNKGLSIELNCKTPMQMLMDEKRIEQLFINLIANSIAYTDAPGKVSIDISQDETSIFVIIDDSPPNVEDDKLDKLFSPLFRLDTARTRRVAGAGLGLTICQNIVEAHNGVISAAQSELGGLSIQMRFSNREIMRHA